MLAAKADTYVKKSLWDVKEKSFFLKDLVKGFTPEEIKNMYNDVFRYVVTYLNKIITTVSSEMFVN